MPEVSREPIAIIGIGCRFPGANGPQEFWELLKAGKSAIREFPPDRWNSEKLYDLDVTQPGKMASRRGGFLEQVDQFDPRAFHIPPGEVKSMDPQQRLLLEVTWEAIEDAGLLFSNVKGSNAGVFIGAGWNDYLRLLTNNWSQIDTYALTGNANSVIANRLSYTFDLKGPSIALDVGCSSSLIAVYLACQSLWNEKADFALAGGVHLLLSPDGPLIISKAGFLSPDGSCNALDARANGTVLGEGAGVVVLKRLSQVQSSDRIYALISGIETNHNGCTDKIIAPSRSAQTELLRKTYYNTGINPANVDYVELHGMGFLRGDAVEVNALGEVLREGRQQGQPCLVGSVKTNIGDLESAAGIASLIKVALALYHREIPPTLNFEYPNPDVSFCDLQLEVPLKARKWPEKDSIPLASVTTLALAGANAHAVLAASPVCAVPDRETHDENAFYLLPFSAHSEEALRSYAATLRDFLRDRETVQASWSNICYTASIHREHRQYRCSVMGRTPQEAANALDAFLQGQEIQAIHNGAEPSLQVTRLQTLGALYTQGHEVGWSALYNEKSQCVSLPSFPWQRDRFWLDWPTLEEMSMPPERRYASSLLPVARQSIAELDISARPLEEVLATLWAEILGVEHVDRHENFFELGGHSLLATQLVARIRAVYGIDFPLNALLQAPTLAACTEALLQKIQEIRGATGVLSTFPTVKSHPQQRYLPFPTTEVQQAYWLGRDILFESIHVGNHGYIEVAAQGLDISRFNYAINLLIERHDMLRAIILSDGRQQILQTVPLFEAAVVDMRDKAAEEVTTLLQSIRQEMDHQILPVDKWPSFDIRIVLLDEQRSQIHLSLEVLFIDAWSTHLLIQEFLQFYHAPDTQLPALELSFRDYVLAAMELSATDLYQKSERYWRQRLSSLPPAPELPLAQDVNSATPRRFVHREAQLDAKSWSHLKKRAAQAGLTPSGFLLAAFAEVIGIWSKNSRFCLDLSVFHRLPLHPQVNDIVGDFTSLIMLAVDCSAPETFEQHARRIQQQLWDDLDHSFYSGVNVLRDRAQMQGNRQQTFMPIVFTSLLIQDVANKYPTPWQETIYCVSQSPQVLLDHQVLESGGKLILHWQSVDALFPPGLLDDMFAAYCQLLDRLAQDDASWQAPNLSLLPPSQQELYTQVHATEAPLTAHLLHTLFTEQVSLRPEQVAVIAPGRLLTYQELFRLSTFFALHLRQIGAQPNRLIGVMMEKGWEQVVAVLSILQAGAAYLPIDPALPEERLLHLLAHGEVEIALTQSWVDRRVPWPKSIHHICVDKENDVAMQREIPPLEPLQNPDDLAYVIYTSGSTGLPKGVMIDHRGAVNTILDINQRFGVTYNDRVLALSALNFDLSVYDIFGILAAGGAIVLPSEATARDPGAWLDLIVNERVTIWNSVPALLQMFLEYVGDHKKSVDETYLRLALLSGDWIPLTLPITFWSLLPQASAVSLGGATEASVWSIFYPITAIDPLWKSIPYGHSMKNQKVCVLDERLRPCPLWVPGQLYIGGVGVAKGYWRDEEKTHKSFIFHPVTGERLYRTGDLGRYLPDGDIEFLGREDFQVKIRGYRIELGEIEAVLSQHEAVHAAVVATYNETQQANNQHLVAYVVPKQRVTTGSAFQEDFTGATLLDPLERTRFKLEQPALRHGNTPNYVRLTRPALDDEVMKLYMERRSHRHFDHTPLSLQQLSDFLNCLSMIEVDGLFKYRYASAGGLYAVQTYLYIKSEQVEGLVGGTYYYHPREHRLILLTPDAEIADTVHASPNQQIFRDSAFSLFLVAHLDAIEPLYGRAAREYCLLEAGYMSQQLQLSANSYQIGTCPVGNLDFKRIRHLFDLQENDVLVHSLLCGKALPPGSQKHVLEQDSFEQEIGDHSRNTPSLIEELKAFLRTKLPEYMIPTFFVQLDQLPLTPNGKIDRRSLPRPARGTYRTEKHPFVAPSTLVEKQLARIWSEVLKTDTPGVHDNFFRLGGHSLLAMRIMLRIREEFKAVLPLQTFFDLPTLAQQAQAIERVSTQEKEQQV